MTRYSINDNWADTRDHINRTIRPIMGVSEEQNVADLIEESPEELYYSLAGCNPNYWLNPDYLFDFTVDELARWMKEEEAAR